MVSLFAVRREALVAFVAALFARRWCVGGARPAGDVGRRGGFRWTGWVVSSAESGGYVERSAWFVVGTVCHGEVLTCR